MLVGTEHRDSRMLGLRRLKPQPDPFYTQNVARGGQHSSDAPSAASRVRDQFFQARSKLRLELTTPDLEPQRNRMQFSAPREPLGSLFRHLALPEPPRATCPSKANTVSTLDDGCGTPPYRRMQHGMVPRTTYQAEQHHGAMRHARGQPDYAGMRGLAHALAPAAGPVLSMPYSELDQLPRELLLNGMVKIELQGNRITALPECISTVLDTLQLLDIRDNLLQELPVSARTLRSH